MAQTRLNLFQQAMHIWDGVHPYNAAHAIRVLGRPDIPRLRGAIERVCRCTGVGELCLDRKSGTFDYQPLREVSLTELPESADPESVLSSVTREGLNAPFPESPHHPIRWTVFAEAGADAHYIVLVYHHVASDAHGIAELLSIVTREYLGVANTAEAIQLSVLDRSADSNRGNRPSLMDCLRGYLRMSRLSITIRWALRLAEPHLDSDHVDVARLRAPDGLFDRLASGCQGERAGINDLFLAVLASVVAGHAFGELGLPRRKVALGTVQSGRRFARTSLKDFFGVRLYNLVIELKDPTADIHEVLRATADQTRLYKTHPNAAVVESAIRILWMKHGWPLLRIPNHRKSYWKYFPLCAGVSTVSINTDRFGTAAPFVSRYIRVAPCGPGTPIALAPTIYSRQLELSLTYRRSCLQNEEAERLLARVMMGLETFAGGNA